MIEDVFLSLWYGFVTNSESEVIGLYRHAYRKASLAIRMAALVSDSFMTLWCPLYLILLHLAKITSSSIHILSFSFHHLLPNGYNNVFRHMPNTSLRFLL